MMVKLLKKLLRETFRSQAYCLMKDELEADGSINEIYVVVRVGMPSITLTTLTLIKRISGWSLSYSVRSARQRLQITKELHSVLDQEYKVFIDALEKSISLRSHYGGVKDGVRYELALTNGHCTLNLVIANPRPGDEHLDVVKKVEETLYSVSQQLENS
jgi:hypothetical protein